MRSQSFSSKHFCTPSNFILFVRHQFKLKLQKSLNCDLTNLKKKPSKKTNHPSPKKTQKISPWIFLADAHTLFLPGRNYMCTLLNRNYWHIENTAKKWWFFAHGDVTYHPEPFQWRRLVGPSRNSGGVTARIWVSLHCSNAACPVQTPKGRTRGCSWSFLSGRKSGSIHHGIWPRLLVLSTQPSGLCWSLLV